MPRTPFSTNEFYIEGQGGVAFDTDFQTITFPTGSKHGTGLHWHEMHAEYLSITQGLALVTLGDETLVVGPEDGVVTIPRYVKHDYRRADAVTDKARDVALIVKEWTEPADGEKQRFFRNVVGVIKDRKQGLLASVWTLCQLFVIFRGLDNYPVLLPMPKLLGSAGRGVERIFTYGVLAIVAIFGWLLGLKVEYPEYTQAA